MFEQKEIATIILILAVSFTASFFIANALISTPEDRAESVLDVTRFDEEYPDPDRRVFNEAAINPTEDISIGDTSTANPFRGQ